MEGKTTDTVNRVIAKKYGHVREVVGDSELRSFKSTVEKASVEHLGLLSLLDIQHEEKMAIIACYVSGVLAGIFLVITLIGILALPRNPGELVMIVGGIVSIMAILGLLISLLRLRDLGNLIGQPKYRVYYVPKPPLRTYVPPSVTSSSRSGSYSSDVDRERKRQEREIRARERYKRAYSGSSPHRRRRYP